MCRRSIGVLVLAALAGCARLNAPVYHGPRSDHFDGERFHNAVRFRDAQIEDGLRKAARGIFAQYGPWPAWVDVTPDHPPERVGMGALRVTFVNHATVLLQMDSLNILTDPIWSKRASPFSWFGPARHRPPGVRFEDLPPIDLVLVSHNHYDHMDLPTLRRLVAAFHPRIVTGLGNAAFLARHGVPGAEEIDWWQSRPLPRGLRVVGVPAQHWSARWIGDKWRTLWMGFVIESSGGPVYFAGDTGYGEFLASIRDRFSPFRFAMLPIAPARPRDAMKARHMSAGEAVRADRLLGVATAMAMHFGTFPQGVDAEREPLDSLALALAAARPCRLRFWGLENGEARYVPPLDSLTLRDGCVVASGEAPR
jgi:L-ascorbate metabolism protein UlaG (beta-lactamase superfamily)